MERFLSALKPAEYGALVGVVLTAVLTALFAIVANLISHRMSRRRSRADYLIEKLEILFVALTDARSAADGRFRKAREFFLRPPEVTGDPTEYVHFSRDMPLDHKINMYVQFYFPRLEARRSGMRDANVKMTAFFHKFSKGGKVKLPDVLEAHLAMLESLKQFQTELVANRDLLVEEPGKRGKYKSMGPDSSGSGSRKADPGAQATYIPSIDSIPSFVSLGDRLATAGPPSVEQLVAVAAAGFDTVINLGRHDGPSYSLPGEAAYVAALGLEYVHIPVQFASPTLEGLGTFSAAMKRAGDSKVFVYCRHNKLVPIFVALDRVLRLGWDWSGALEAMRAVWMPDRTWQRFIDDALAGSAP